MNRFNLFLKKTGAVEEILPECPVVRKQNRVPLRLTLPALACLTLAVGCAGVPTPTAPVAMPETGPGKVTGYLPASVLPNSLTLLPPPPAPKSVAFAADQAAYRAARTLRDTPRWALAIQDANLDFPAAPEAFSCALDAPITPDATPQLYTLLHRSFADAGLATNAAKNHYQRTRPFVVNRKTSCTPQDEPRLSKNGSYPSGHTTIGWTWALLLTELMPDRTDPLLARGYAFGQSRVICGIHWQSDVTAGRVVAAGVVARLHADPTFQAQLAAAKTELDAVRAKGLKPTRDCPAEAAALALQIPPLP
jgi:acid phosphatase (class A)